MGLLDGKVILITGAGNGLGRAHALACAKEGAKIVVNDLGGARDGSGGAATAADAVVSEIVALGSDAVANHDSVTDKAGCARMVQAAMDRWGRLDAVVNNAGILRDVTFRRMDDAQWAAVIDVHLNGTYNVTRAAVEALAASGGGAIVNTTSYSGMIGNFGQSNYGAAKAGIYAFTRVLALELRKANITANCLAPIAKTRMTEDIAMVDADWTPEQVAPMVVFLCSELARGVTGKVFGVQGNRIHVYEVKVNDGVEKPGAEPWTAAEIAEKLDAICSFEAPAPAAARAPEQDIVSSVFAHFPAGFRTGKQPTWSAIIHWVVKGGADQTVTVANDTVQVAAGLHGKPTCTVKVDKDTLVAMFKGELAPEKAFMSGKAVADNMGDLLKFGAVFDFKKIGASYAAAQANPGAAPPAPPPAAQNPVDLAFQHIPGAFIPEKAGDFKATIHFVIKDGPAKTVQIGGGRAWVEDGLQGTPACTIKTDTATVVGMMNNTVDAQKAFMGGKITADNMGVLMKFAMFFRFDQAARAPAPAPAAPAQVAPVAAAEPAPRAWPIGKIYHGGYALVDPALAQAYAEATNDPHVAYYGPEGVAPPMFHMRLLYPVFWNIATDPELGLDLLRLVHGEHDATFHRPLKHWDLVQVRGVLEAVEEKSSGLLVVSRLYGFVDGVVAVEARTSFFIRGSKKGESKKDAPEALPAPTFTRPIKVAPDQSYRYAKASLDENPIHIDPATAKAAGLPDVILHGLCTMALAGKAVTDVLAAGDPRFLRRLSVRFARPVLNGSTLTVKGWRKRHSADFIVVDEQGNPVITSGVAEVRS